MKFTEQITQAMGIPINSIYPTNGTGTVNTLTAIPIKNYHRLMAHVIQGLGAGTVTAYWCGCATTNGTYVALATNQVLNLGVSVNTEGTLEVRADQFSAGQLFAQLTITVAGTASNIAAHVYGANGPYEPVGGTGGVDVATVAAGGPGLIARLVSSI